MSHTILISTTPLRVSTGDVRCHRCGRLLLRWVAGSCELELKCPRCGSGLIVALSTSAA